MKIIAENRKAYHDYFIDSTIECGIVLSGSEVKSARNSKINLKDSYVTIKSGEAFLINANISTYDKTSAYAESPTRTRKLLLHKSEIDKLERKIKEKGFTLVPTKAYFNKQLVKLEVGIAKGKQLFDKKQDKINKDYERETERELKSIHKKGL